MTEQGLKHEQLSEALRREIESGTFGDRGKLPGEHDLAARYSVSRNTVRHALASLQRSGIIQTAPGAGSFVTYDGHDIDADVGWSKALAAHGVIAEPRILKFEKVDDPLLASRLGLSSASFIALDRLRLASDDACVSLERSRIPNRPEVETLPERGLLNGSLTESLVAAGLVPWTGEEWAEITRLDAESAESMERDVGEPFLRLTTLVSNASGQVIEHVVSILDPAHFRLHLRYGGEIAAE